MSKMKIYFFHLVTILFIFSVLQLGSCVDKAKFTHPAAQHIGMPIGTPIDLNRIIDIRKPNTRVYYDLQEIGCPNLDELLEDFLESKGLME